MARDEDYPETVTETDVEIPMSDGEVLRADVIRPANADGHAIEHRFPVLVTITPYNKTMLRNPMVGTLAGGGTTIDYLVKRSYVQVIADVRGTGASAGEWDLFNQREQLDSAEIIDWAASPDQPWSNGTVGMYGASYMGMSPLFAARQRPPALKAVFSQVPAADLYRDLFTAGGNTHVGFMPMWLAFVTGAGIVPPAYSITDPVSAINTLLDHLTGTATETLPLLLESLTGGNKAYDGPFYWERSPITALDRDQVPTFLIGGWYDLFQRGVPLIFDQLQQQGVPAKMLYGPWDHVQICSGDGITDAGLGSLNELQLRWFDHHVRDVPDPALDGDIPPLTWQEINSEQWHHGQDWISTQHAVTFHLSGTAALGSAGTLTQGGHPEPGESTVIPVPVSGVLTRSTNQTLAGLLNAIGLNSVVDDNRWNDATGIVFDTAPMVEPLHVLGPINAHLYTSSPTGNGSLALSVSSVSPEGEVNRLTGGWQVLSHREVDKSRSRYLEGELIQPWHPFTEEAHTLMEPGEVAAIDVEIYPTGAVIPSGHALRLAIHVFDVPHVLPSLPDVAATLSPLTIYVSDRYPSTLTLPVLPSR